MSYISPFAAIVLSVLALDLLLLYYFYQKKRVFKNTSFRMGDMISRFKNWRAGRTRPSTKEDLPPSSITTTEDITVINEGETTHVKVSADFPRGSTVHVTVKVVGPKGISGSEKRTLTEKGTVGKGDQTASSLQGISSKIRQIDFLQIIRWARQPENMGAILLGAAVVLYALVISFRIDRFPIYFFTDEAIHMNLVADFLRDGLKNYDREFLPTFFIAEGWVNGTSVYVQVLPYLLFGKSVAVTRLVSAFITLLAALSLGLLLKQVFKIKYHWTAVFLLLTTPAWFLHARTAFEYAEVASFYMLFLYFYARYRDGHLPSLYAAILSGALAFYTHGLGQILMTITGLALFITDFRYHIHPDRRRTVLYGLGLGLILLLPFARYYLAHLGESAAQVKRRGSYWYNDELTTLQKVYEFITQYATIGLNPLYWYFHGPIELSSQFIKDFGNGWKITLPFNVRFIDLSRHVMKNYGNGLVITLPFAIIGFIKVLRNLHQPPYRLALIAFLAAPLPASIVAIGMPRMLWMSMPMAIITALGLSVCLEQLERYWGKVSRWLPSMAFLVLASLSVFMLRDALVNGPIWFDDYGLYGMQYGAKQIFADTIVTELKKDPNLTFVVSPSWANGTDKFADFFIPKDLLPRVSFGQPADRIGSPSSITPDTRFIMPYNEYDNIIKNPKFKDIVVHRIIPYPNGQPGFYITSVSPSDTLSEILAAERIKNITPVEDTVEINGQQVRVVHSPFDSGGLVHIFDDDPDTLVRVLEANPFSFDLYPPTPLDTNGVVIQTASLPDFTVTISLYATEADAPQIYTETFKNLPNDPVVTMTFDRGPSKSARIYIEIKDNLSGESSQIHVRKIEFK
jgi:hypothetical protein